MIMVIIGVDLALQKLAETGLSILRKEDLSRPNLEGKRFSYSIATYREKPALLIAEGCVTKS